jgi:hypothetical protein
LNEIFVPTGHFNVRADIVFLTSSKHIRLKRGLRPARLTTVRQRSFEAR